MSFFYVISTMKGKTELIFKIKGLKEIKPGQDWVLFTKKQILGEAEAPSFSFKESFLGLFQYKYKPAFATLVIVGVLIGTFGLAQNALPSDSLYPIRKITEKVMVSFVSKDRKPSLQLGYANRRLEDLFRVAQANQEEEIKPIIKEYQADLSNAAISLNRIEESGVAVKDIVQETKKIEENKEKIKALGIIIGEAKDFESALKPFVEREIEELENKALSQRQIEIFEGAKEDYEEGNYSQALEKILLLSYPQDK